MNNHEKKTLLNLGLGASIVGNVLLGVETTSLKGEIRRLHAQNRGLADEVAALSEEKHQLQDALALRDAALEAARKRSGELDEQVSALGASVDALSQEKAALQDAIDAKDEEARIANQQLASERADRAAVETRIKELEDEISRLREQKSPPSPPAEGELCR
jgi:chromosome segregation ATPase